MARRKIENDFSRLDNYNCFACSPNHPFGLHMEFFYEDESRTVTSIMTPGALFDGFPGILHGGIQATVLDEVAFWGVWACYQKSGFTLNIQLSYKKKCPTCKNIEARGIIGERDHRIIPVEVSLQDPDSKLIYTSGIVRYFTA